MTSRTCERIEKVLVPFVFSRTYVYANWVNWRSMKSLTWSLLPLLFVSIACGDDDVSSDASPDTTMMCGGGCSVPPLCTEPADPCSCGCIDGETFNDKVCMGGCLIPATEDLVACVGSAAMGTAPADTQTEKWRSLSAPPSSGDVADATIDTANCGTARFSSSLPLGSAWLHTTKEADRCLVWLGGETENPAYDGLPTQHCNFPLNCETFSVQVGSGGPATLDSPYCTQ